MDIVFFVNSILLGIGLAMDAFSVSMANGLNEPDMKMARMNLIAGIYGLFQFAMPMIGWICVHSIAEKFIAFQKYIPYIALILLLYVGGGMIKEAGSKKNDNNASQTICRLSFSTLIVQGIATSIDALSVGFTISDYTAKLALAASLIIAFVTHIICLSGLCIGKKFGTKLSAKASVFGGAILILIGIEIFLKGVIFQ